MPRSGLREGIQTVNRWYIQGFIPAEENRDAIRQPSLAQCAKASGISLVTIEKHSVREGWSREKEEFQRQLKEKEKAKLMESMAEQHVNARAAYFRSSMKILQAINRIIQNDVDGELKASDLNMLASAMAKAQKITDEAVLGRGTVQPQPVEKREWTIFQNQRKGEAPGGFGLDLKVQSSMEVQVWARRSRNVFWTRVGHGAISCEKTDHL